MLQNIAAATNSLPCLLCQQADQLISGASLDSDGMFRCYVRWPSHRLSVHDHSLKKILRWKLASETAPLTTKQAQDWSCDL